MKIRRRVLETVLCFVVDAEGRFLFMARGKKPGDVHAGKYNSPGGKIEQGESPREAMIREVFEETGLHVTEARWLGYLAFPAFHEDGEGGIDESVHVFLVTRWTGTLREDCPEGELEWVPGNKVLELPLWEGDRTFIPFVISGTPFEGVLRYEKGELRSAEVEPILTK